jgi:RNA polymerase sigma-70 factor (ECF subfamily)
MSPAAHPGPDRSPPLPTEGSGGKVRTLRPQTETPTAELVQRARQGDRWAEEALYRRHVGSLTGVVTRLLASRQDAEDVVQDTFVTAFEKIGQLREPEAFGAWLLQIGVRHVSARFRKRALLRILGVSTAPDALLGQLASPATPPDVRAELALLDGALQQLPARARIPWMLRHVEERDLAEVARLCQCSLATVKRRIASAEIEVRAHLKEVRRD